MTGAGKVRLRWVAFLVVLLAVCGGAYGLDQYTQHRTAHQNMYNFCDALKAAYGFAALSAKNPESSLDKDVFQAQLKVLSEDATAVGGLVYLDTYNWAQEVDSDSLQPASASLQTLRGDCDAFGYPEP